jgi:hypothetical protein
MESTNDFMKKMRLGGDARSTRGILSRGKNIYNGTSYSSTGGNLQNAARERLKDAQRRQLK